MKRIGFVLFTIVVLSLAMWSCKEKRSTNKSSVNVVQNEVDTSLIYREKSLNEIRDSLRKGSVFEYFNSIGLPMWESITESDVEHGFAFTETDEEIIPRPNEYVDESRYLGQWRLNDFVCVVVFHYIDCESFRSLYTIDSNFQIIDKSMILRNGGCEADIYGYEIRYQNYIVSTDNFNLGRNLVSFENDSIFTETYIGTTFYLEDVDTKEVIKELGEKTEIKYRIDNFGKIVEIERSGFKKEYVDLFWNYVEKNRR